MEEADESQRQKGHRIREKGTRQKKQNKKMDSTKIYIYGYEIGEGEAR